MRDVRHYQPPPDEYPGQGEVMAGLAVIALFSLFWSLLCAVAGAYLFAPAIYN
jgi:hypothetical protein